MAKKVGKILICGFLSFVLLVALPYPPGAYAESSGGSQSWYDNNPEASAFTIGTGAELAYLAQLVNSGVAFSGKTVTLSSNIDLSAYDNWIPIGKSVKGSFQGTFDGMDHGILNLNISGKNNTGLFGYVIGGTIKNLGIVSGTVNGQEKVGGIVGSAASNSTIFRCYNKASVAGTNHVGGIAGQISQSVINGCYNAGAVSGSESVGGVVGSRMDGPTIEKNWNLGTVQGSYRAVGGIAGYVFTSGGVFEQIVLINNCYNAGNITGPGQQLGGIVGTVYQPNENKITANCYNLPSLAYPINGEYGGTREPLTITNCYYLSSQETGDGGKTAAAFSNGEVAALLNGSDEVLTWGMGKVNFPGLEEAPVLISGNGEGTGAGDGKGDGTGSGDGSGAGDGNGSGNGSDSGQGPDAGDGGGKGDQSTTPQTESPADSGGRNADIAVNNQLTAVAEVKKENTEKPAEEKDTEVPKPQDEPTKSGMRVYELSPITYQSLKNPSFLHSVLLCAAGIMGLAGVMRYLGYRLSLR